MITSPLPSFCVSFPLSPIIQHKHTPQVQGVANNKRSHSHTLTASIGYIKDLNVLEDISRLTYIKQSWLSSWSFLQEKAPRKIFCFWSSANPQFWAKVYRQSSWPAVAVILQWPKRKIIPFWDLFLSSIAYYICHSSQWRDSSRAFESFMFLCSSIAIKGWIVNDPEVLIVFVGVKIVPKDLLLT